jgi:hypothetical protein
MNIGGAWTPAKSGKLSGCGTACGFLKRRAARQRLCAGGLKSPWLNENDMQLDHLRVEIERMRTQVHRQRGEIRQLQRAGISTASAEALLERMLTNIDGMCAERDKLKKELSPVKGRVLGGRSWHV